ncbi:MAG: cell division protein SepF [Ruminococcus sp.]|nr:cell division protein SepF [Ruminococcus sp.]
MKSNFLNGLKDKFLSVADVSDEDEAYYDDDEYDIDEEEFEGSNTSAFDSQPKFDFDYSSNSAFNRAAESHDSGASFESKFTKKQNSNIYQMNNNNAKTAAKVARVVYFFLEDPDDARNIADCMIAQDAIVLVDMSKLGKDEALCVLHFLDGVRYIYKSKTETIIDNIYLIVPQSIELAGDFYEQVNQGSFF